MFKNYKKTNTSTPYVISKTVWLVTAIVFLINAMFTYSQVSIILPPYKNDVQTRSEFIDGVDIGATVDGLVSSYDNNVSVLQQTVRKSAQTSFWLDLLSSAIAFLGLYGQIRQTQENKGNDKKGAEK